MARKIRGAILGCITGLIAAFCVQSVTAQEIIDVLDYSDDFSLGEKGRANGACCRNDSGAYDVEVSYGNPPSTWTPFTIFSFTDIPGSFGAGPAVLAAATGNLGAATGIAQSGGGDFSFAYGLRTNYIVEVDAFLSPGDRTDISSLPNPGDSIFTPSSLSVFFRRDSIDNNGIGIFNGTVETPVTDQNGQGVRTGVDDDNWHTLAVNFNQITDRLVIYVDGDVKADLDLSTFAGGAYREYSNGAVGVGGAGAFVDNKVLWFDNFRVGGKAGPWGCFTHDANYGVAPLTVRFDASCSERTDESFQWDFGDGESATGRLVEHTYSASGLYPVILALEDAGEPVLFVITIIIVYQPILTFDENFNRPEGEVEGWTVTAGKWSQAGNKLIAGPTGAEQWIWAGDIPVAAPANASFEFDYRFTAPGTDAAIGRHGGFQFHCTAPTQRTGDGAFSGYFIDWIDRASDRGPRLTRSDAGEVIDLANFGLGNLLDEVPAEPPAHWQIEVNGDQIRVFGDDVLFIEVLDGTYRSGFFGFWTWAGGQEVEIDNLWVSGEALMPCFTIAPDFPVASASLRFDAGCSSVFGGFSKIVSQSWDFGDGSMGSGMVVEHSYPFPDVYDVTLTIEDDTGATASISPEVTVFERLYPFADCFDRKAGPVTGWTPVLGDWQITTDGRLATTTTTGAPDGESWIYPGDPGGVLQGDFVAEFEVPTAAFNGDPTDGIRRHFGIYFFGNTLTTNRYAADSTGYTFWWIDRQSDFGLSLARWDGAGFTLLQGGTGELFDKPPTRWRIEVEGPSIRLFGDGTLAIDVEDESYREGHFGFWAWKNMTLEIDEFIIPPASVVPEACDLVATCELTESDPPQLKITGAIVGPEEVCGGPDTCLCDMVEVLIDGESVAVIPVEGEEIDVTIDLPDPCEPDSERQVAVRCLGGEVSGGVEPTCAFICPEERGGGQIIADCNQDGKLDISDAVCTLGFLFIGIPGSLPCGDGTSRDHGNITLLDTNDDGKIDLSDCVFVLDFLFTGGPPLAGGPGCMTILACPDVCEADGAARRPH